MAYPTIKTRTQTPMGYKTTTTKVRRKKIVRKTKDVTISPGLKKFVKGKVVGIRRPKKKVTRTRRVTRPSGPMFPSY